VIHEASYGAWSFALEKGGVFAVDSVGERRQSEKEDCTCDFRPVQCAGCVLVQSWHQDSSVPGTCGVARETPRSSVLLPALGKPTSPMSASSFISSSRCAVSPVFAFQNTSHFRYKMAELGRTADCHSRSDTVATQRPEAADTGVNHAYLRGQRSFLVQRSIAK